MDQSDHILQQQHQNLQQRLPVVGVVPGSGSVTYANPYEAAQVKATGTPAVAVSSPTTFPASLSSQQQQLTRQQLQAFWANQMQELPLFLRRHVRCSSWSAEENKRRTLQKNDIASAISRTDVFDFLVDFIPRDELREVGLGVSKATIPLVGSPSDAIPYYYVPQHPVGPAGMIMGKPADQATLFTGQHSQPPLCHGSRHRVSCLSLESNRATPQRGET
ncbi:nuclear transcription factor Y subunit C-2-like [Olea europaea subsp. europaea]|uniref:Nuclear transcription factor Y subunit C-2-like n=1 Tax=Olea europaea subsp. europaea TaxID=158383 RepID=A0A8S0U2F9_OLEEU|nr:nuclear transcription factor Y subunit C-2-like [Olea europaea subsp. europaea]